MPTFSSRPKILPVKKILPLKQKGGLQESTLKTKGILKEKSKMGQWVDKQIRQLIKNASKPKK